jgi:HEAT repeat protein
LLIALLLLPVPAIAQEESDRFDQLLQKAQTGTPDEQVDAFLQLAEFPDKVDRLLIPLVEGMIGPDSRVGEAAQFAADQMGKEMAAYCDQQLDSEDQKQVSAAAEMIYRLGDVAIGSTPKLVALTKSESSKLRLSGLWGLVHLKNSDPSVVKAIEPFLDDPDFRRQVVACRAIATIGPPAVELAGKLKTLVEEGNLSTRSHAMIALGSIGPNPEFDVVELLGQHLDVFLQPERDRALIGIAKLGPQAASLKDKVEALMNNPDKNVQPQAALTLWKITGDPAPSLQALIEMSKNANLQYEALNGIYQMGDVAASAVDDIAKHLQNPDEAMRSLAVEILGSFGSKAAAHKETLERMSIDDSDPIVRFYCRQALQAIEGARPSP